MASPLSIVPGGIGTGEAQVIGTPMTDRAILVQQQLSAKKNQEQKLKEAEDIAKINVEGVHQPDTKQIMEAYNGVIDSYDKYSRARDRGERASAKIEYEKAKADLQFNIANSKDYNKQIYEISNTLLGANDGDYDEEQRNYLRELRSKPSFGQTVDLNRFNKKPKPLDVLEINKKIIDASKIDKSTVFKPGMVGDTEVIITENGEALSKSLFFDNLASFIQQTPRYAQEVLVPKYKDEYIKAGNDIKDGQKFTEYIFNNEFESKRPSVDVTKQSASQKSDGAVFNFGGGGPNHYKDPNTGEMIVGDIKIEKINKSKGTERYVVPLRNSTPFNLDFTADLSQGAYSLEDGLEKIQLNETPQVKASAIVELPYEVVNGKDVLLPSKGSVSVKSGDATSETPINRKNKPQPRYKKFIQVQTVDDDKVYYIPLENVPIDKFVRADDPVLKTVASWGGQTSAPAKGQGYSKDEETGIAAFMKAQKIDRAEAIKILKKAGRLK